LKLDPAKSRVIGTFIENYLKLRRPSKITEFV
jgi:hypothetical protein